jgi:hypothetical protein
MPKRKNQEIIISVQQPSIIMISSMLIKDIVSEKMYLNQTQLMNTCIIDYVLLLTEEPLNFYNCYAKTITKKEKT